MRLRLKTSTSTDWGPRGKQYHIQMICRLVQQQNVRMLDSDHGHHNAGLDPMGQRCNMLRLRTTTDTKAAQSRPMHTGGIAYCQRQQRDVCRQTTRAYECSFEGKNSEELAAQSQGSAKSTATLQQMARHAQQHGLKHRKIVN